MVVASRPESAGGAATDAAAARATRVAPARRTSSCESGSSAAAGTPASSQSSRTWRRGRASNRRGANDGSRRAPARSWRHDPLDSAGSAPRASRTSHIRCERLSTGRQCGGSIGIPAVASSARWSATHARPIASPGQTNPSSIRGAVTAKTSDLSPATRSMHRTAARQRAVPANAGAPRTAVRLTCQYSTRTLSRRRAVSCVFAHHGGPTRGAARHRARSARATDRTGRARARAARSVRESGRNSEVTGVTRRKRPEKRSHRRGRARIGRLGSAGARARRA